MHTPSQVVTCHSFGFTGSALMWVQSCLTGRSQTVRLGSHCSSSTLCSVGVPRGSVLGPLLFTICTSPISHIAASHNIQQHQYADDTQLFVALTSNNAHAQLSTLEFCLNSLQAWFCSDSMTMNPKNSIQSSLPPLSALIPYPIRSLCQYLWRFNPTLQPC